MTQTVDGTSCPQCGGTGVWWYVRDQETRDPVEDKCDLCNGRGRITVKDIVAMNQTECTMFAVEVWRRFCNARANLRPKDGPQEKPAEIRLLESDCLDRIPTARFWHPCSSPANMTDPMEWSGVTKCLICGDMFAPHIPVTSVERWFAVMYLNRHITFNLRTAHPQAMEDFFRWPFSPKRVANAVFEVLEFYKIDPKSKVPELYRNGLAVGPLIWPLANVETVPSVRVKWNERIY